MKKTPINVPPPALALLLLLGCLALLAELAPGCGAYYNTFYHARKRYHEASRQLERSGLEHPSPQVLSLYQQAIDKSEKVILDFPDSKWVDDARYLIGMARLGREEYEKARVAFQRLIDFHPESQLVPDAKLGIGQSYLGLGDFEAADRVLGELLDAYPDFERTDDVLLQLARSAAQRHEHRRAIASYSNLLAAAPGTRVAIEALRGRAEAYVVESVYDSALTDFRVAEHLIKEPDTRYEVELRVGYCLEQLGYSGEALTLYTQLERLLPDAQHLPRTLVQRAGVLNTLGRYPEALEVYERVVEKYPTSTYAAQAQFQIGITYEVHLNDYDQAKEAFAKVRERSPRSEFVQLAEQRARDLELYGEYRQQAAAGEGAADQQAEAAYKLAELKLLRLKQPEEALAAFREVEASYPESRYAAKAMYAIGYVYENQLADTTAALAAYDSVYARFPGTEYGIHAGVRTGALDPDSLSILVGRLRLRAAHEDSLRQAVLRAAAVDSAAAAADSAAAVAAAALAAADSLAAAAGGDSLAGTAAAADSLAASAAATGDSLAGTAAAGDTLAAVAPDSLRVARGASVVPAGAAGGGTRLPVPGDPRARQLFMERQLARRDSIFAARRAHAESLRARRSVMQK